MKRYLKLHLSEVTQLMIDDLVGAAAMSARQQGRSGEEVTACSVVEDCIQAVYHSLLEKGKAIAEEEKSDGSNHAELGGGEAHDGGRGSAS